MNLTPKHNKNDFNRHLFRKIDLHLYHHKFLKTAVDQAIAGQRVLNDSSILNTTANGWILIIHSDELLIYGKNWTIEQFQELREEFDLNIYSNFLLSGEEELINELVNFYNPKNLKIVKQRILYQSNKIDVFTNNNTIIRQAVRKDSNELAKMLQRYYHEEYNGLNDKKIEEMKELMLSKISNEDVYVLLDANDQILSFCTINNPDIGILFTKEEHRNKGYGKVILSYCSSLLEQINEKVFVMTDREKIDSNIVCTKVGFEPYYNYKSILINCT